MARLFSWAPDWVVFGVIALIFIIIYLAIDREMRTSVNIFMQRFGFWILLILAWFYARTKFGKVYQYQDKVPGILNSATFWLIFAVGLFFFIKFLFYHQRYKTAFAVFNGMKGCCHRYEERGDWAIFFLGTTGRSDRQFVVTLPSVHQIVVIPKIAVDFLGENIVGKSQVVKCDLLDLPEDVKDYLDADPQSRRCIQKGEIYFGLWSEKLKMEDPKYEDIESTLQKTQDRLNQTNTMLKAKMKDVREFINATTGSYDKIRGRDWAPSRRQEDDA